MGLLGQEITVTVNQSEYRMLLELYGRVSAFKEFVNQHEYSVTRETCAAILGFELPTKENKDAGTDRE